MRERQEVDETAEAEVVLLGGRYDRQRVRIARTPNFIAVDGVRYQRVDDPDTGEPLGAYVLVDSEGMLTL